ncbi:hypothetical protein [Schinkia azotoformans]|uniref:hypothetical protein n=1 Tax=Schinkia azotoformans TaxID=1454 RepID=UPI002DBA221C|nr:hypothetical protein [Schinkia azotoformans]MEC1778418.1 hypothetical protein [Schinkia azotoformans]MED4328337.1 hypothetical protein [Schinkia azotoformans]
MKNTEIDNKLKSYEEVKHECTPIPGFDPNMYVCHTLSGRVYSKLTNKWLLENSKGTGDRDENGEGKYLITSLKKPNGETVPLYLHEIVYSSFYGIEPHEWKSEGYEINHIDRTKTRDCSIGNLEKVDRLTQYSDEVRAAMRIKGYLNKELAIELRKQFADWDKGKVQFYYIKGKELGVCARTIQNVILGVSFKDVGEPV